MSAPCLLSWVVRLSELNNGEVGAIIATYATVTSAATPACAVLDLIAACHAPLGCNQLAALDCTAGNTMWVADQPPMGNDVDDSNLNQIEEDLNHIEGSLGLRAAAIAGIAAVRASSSFLRPILAQFSAGCTSYEVDQQDWR